MFLFSSPSENTELDRIEDRANPPATSVGLPLAATIALGGLGMAAGGAVVGGCLAALPAYVMVKRLGKSFKNAVFINANPGCYAHLIKTDRDMIAYIEIHGVDDVRNQLLLADRQGQRMTSCAKRTYRELVKDRPHRKVGEYLAAQSEATKQSQQIAATTQTHGNSRTVALPISQQAGQAQDATTQTYNPGGYFDPCTGEGSIVLDLVLQSPGISRLMIGGQRTGKSYFAAVASRLLAHQEGWKIFHVNLASYGSEDDYYWAHVYKSVRGDLSSITDEGQAMDLIANAIDLVNEFVGAQKAILICDEIAFTGSKYGKWDASGFLRVVAEQISALTSTGMKRERAIWALCPELVAGAMRDETKAIKSLNLLYFAIAPGMSVDWNGQAVKFDESVHQQVTANFKGVDMPTAEQVSICRRQNLPRIAYLGKEWFPLGDLPTIKQPAIAKPSAYAVVNAAPTVEPTMVDAELPQLYEAIARMTVAQTFETPGTINPNGTKEPLTSADAKAELLRYLSTVDEPKKVNQIRSGAKSPVHMMPSSKIRLLLAELVDQNKIREVGARFIVNT
jgi:hypothetical protein